MVVSKKAGQKSRGKVKLKRETLRDLDAGKRAGRVKAGAAKSRGCVLETIASCITCVCRTIR